MNFWDFKLVGAVFGGLVVAWMLSTATTIKERLTSIVSGVFAALFFTEPVIGWAELEFSGVQYAVAGLLAMSGDRLARRIVGLIDTVQLPGVKK